MGYNLTSTQLSDSVEEKYSGESDEGDWDWSSDDEKVCLICF